MSELIVNTCNNCGTNVECDEEDGNPLCQTCQDMLLPEARITIKMPAR